MDPHSTHSQFNRRIPKSGPKAINARFADLMPHPKPLVDTFLKRSTTVPRKPVPSALALVRRPIATNSRIKQDEKYKKDMYLTFVYNALQQKTNGISEPFEELVDQFNPRNLSGRSTLQLAQLRLWISALSHVVSRLEHIHVAVVHAVVNMPWTILDSTTVKDYTTFIGMLISARPEYLSLVLGKIAQGFTYQSGIQVIGTGLPEASSSPLTRRIIYDRLHDLLRHLLSLIPTLSSTLQPLLVRNFPHKRQNQIAQTIYIRNLLRVSVYCPEIANQILATIVDRAIQIDVEIQIELEELDEANETIPDQGVFDLDPFDTVVGQEGEESDSENGDADEDADNLSDLSSDAGEMDDMAENDSPMNVTYIQGMVKKLDAILTLIFDHFERNYTSVTISRTPPPLPELPPLDSSISLSISPPFTQSISPPPKLPLSDHIAIPSSPEPSSGGAEGRHFLLRAQFLTLLSIFDQTILCTFKSRYTQFLVFWFTSLDPEFSDIFQGMLVDRALFEFSIDSPTRTGTPVVTRAAAASYIGSFVSRAKFVDKDSTRRIISVLCEFLKVHLDSTEAIRDGGLVPGGTSQHTVFYAVVQAVFLIFCFRWRDLLEGLDGDDEFLVERVDKAGNKWMSSLSILQRVVTSTLNPLRVCSTNVVMQFVQVAHATSFIYCYPILETNKRSEGESSNTEVRGHPNAKTQSGVHLTVLERAVNPELNTFFPFDPYRLPKSNTYIHDIYREWSSVAINDGYDDEEEEEEEDDRNANEDKPDLGLTQEEEGLGVSLGKMSISPLYP